jgi:hypothetical protein
MKLHLGVVDVPYTYKDKSSPKTTGDVAEILEDKYHVIELFYEEMGADTIAAALEESARVAVEDMFSGVNTNLYGPVMSDIMTLTYEATEEMNDAFKIFIDQKELDGAVPGVPTAASLKGVNHRLKHPYAKDNPVRPSFKDTGLYQTSFRAWAEE